MRIFFQVFLKKSHLFQKIKEKNFHLIKRGEKTLNIISSRRKTVLDNNKKKNRNDVQQQVDFRFLRKTASNKQTKRFTTWILFNNLEIVIFFLLFGHLSSHSSFFPHHHRFLMFELFLIRKTLWERKLRQTKIDAFLPRHHRMMMMMMVNNDQTTRIIIIVVDVVDVKVCASSQFS